MKELISYIESTMTNNEKTTRIFYYTPIPYGYDWDELIEQMRNDEEWDSLNFESDMLSLIHRKNIRWTEVYIDNSKDGFNDVKDGLYVSDFENDSYLVIYKGKCIFGIG